MVKVTQKGRKRCGKRRNCLLRAISPFSTEFSEDLHCRHVETRPRAYKTFFVLNSAEHEISKLDKSNLINVLE